MEAAAPGLSVSAKGEWATESEFDSVSKALRMYSVAGVMVSIVAFQAVDPGSIPGRRTFLLFLTTEDADFFPHTH